MEYCQIGWMIIHTVGPATRAMEIHVSKCEECRLTLEREGLVVDVTKMIENRKQYIQ